jgi:glycosyltransferase involved in cell wall biosynthesis
VTLGFVPIVAVPRGDAHAGDGVSYVRVTSRGEVGDPTDLRWSRKALRAAIRDAGPDLVHVVGDPWTPTAEAGAAAARDLKVPYALVGTSIVGGPGGAIARWQAKRVLDGASALAGLTRPALDHLANGTTGRPVGVIPPGGIAIPSYWTPRTPGTPLTLGTTGRLMRERGHDVLIDALGTIFGDWRLRVVGTGPAQEALEGQAQRLGLSARIEWLGAIPRDELEAFWPTIDVLVTPSRVTPTWAEPSGQLVLDAMAHGVAAVVTRSGALPDVVGESGLIVDPEDCPALARALQGLLEQPGRVRSLGAAGRQRVLEQYGDVVIAQRMAALWTKVREMRD